MNDVKRLFRLFTIHRLCKKAFKYRMIRGSIDGLKIGSEKMESWKWNRRNGIVEWKLKKPIE